MSRNAEAFRKNAATVEELAMQLAGDIGDIQSWARNQDMDASTRLLLRTMQTTMQKSIDLGHALMVCSHVVDLDNETAAETLRAIYAVSET